MDSKSAGRAGVIALARGIQASMVTDISRFRGRLSSRVAEKVIAAGVDTPERLLFMSRAGVKAMPGIGKVGLAEIAAYRAKFLPPDVE